MTIFFEADSFLNDATTSESAESSEVEIDEEVYKEMQQRKEAKMRVKKNAAPMIKAPAKSTRPSKWESTPPNTLHHYYTPAHAPRSVAAFMSHLREHVRRTEEPFLPQLLVYLTKLSAWEAKKTKEANEQHEKAARH